MHHDLTFSEPGTLAAWCRTCRQDITLRALVRNPKCPGKPLEACSLCLAPLEAVCDRCGALACSSCDRRAHDGVVICAGH